MRRMVLTIILALLAGCAVPQQPGNDGGIGGTGAPVTSELQ